MSPATPPGVEGPCKRGSPILRFRLPELSVQPPCSTEGASGGVWLAEPRCGARVAVSQTAHRVVSDHRPRPSLDGGCLRWLDVDRMKGGAGARLDRGEVKARPSGTRKSGPRGETPRWSAGRRACRLQGTRRLT